MWIHEWANDRLEIAKIDLGLAQWRLSRAAQETRLRSYTAGYARGHSDAALGRPTKHQRPKGLAGHPQVEIHGIEVDEQLAPLLETLWTLGLDTQFSCQGQPEYFLSHHPESWDNSAQIFFSDAAQGLKFVKTSIELLGHDGYHDGGFRMNICNGVDSEVLRGDVRFSPDLIAELTERWAAFELTVT